MHKENKNAYSCNFVVACRGISKCQEISRLIIGQATLVKSSPGQKNPPLLLWKGWLLTVSFWKGGFLRRFKKKGSYVAEPICLGVIFPICRLIFTKT